jgi:hypothetical protein
MNAKPATIYVPVDLARDPDIIAELDAFQDRWPELHFTRRMTDADAFTFEGPDEVETEDGETLSPAPALASDLKRVLVYIADDMAPCDRIRALK